MNEKHTIVAKIKPENHAELNRIKTLMNPGKNNISYVVDEIIKYCKKNNIINDIFPQLRKEND